MGRGGGRGGGSRRWHLAPDQDGNRAEPWGGHEGLTWPSSWSLTSGQDSCSFDPGTTRRQTRRFSSFCPPPLPPAAAAAAANVDAAFSPSPPTDGATRGQGSKVVKKIQASAHCPVSRKKCQHFTAPFFAVIAAKSCCMLIVQAFEERKYNFSRLTSFPERGSGHVDISALRRAPSDGRTGGRERKARRGEAGRGETRRDERGAGQGRARARDSVTQGRRKSATRKEKNFSDSHKQTCIFF